MKNKNIKTQYIRLLSYPNACKVIEFINKNDKLDYAYVTTGGVAVQVSNKNWNTVMSFIESLKVRYEINNEPPYKTTEKIIETLKSKKVI